MKKNCASSWLFTKIILTFISSLKAHIRTVQWSGVEWSGVEWSGVEWSGVEWSGVEWQNGEM